MFVSITIIIGGVLVSLRFLVTHSDVVCIHIHNDIFELPTGDFTVIIISLTNSGIA